MTQLTIKWPFSFQLHPTSASAVPGKNRTDNICIKINKKLPITFHLSGYVATNSQSITRIDFCAAARLLNRFNI